MIQHNVIQGDSLWRLAHRYLGSGTRWPLIFNFHNENHGRFGGQSRLFPIRNENLIYVGQIVLVPARTKEMPAGTGTKAEGDRAAIPVELKVEYTLGKDTPPLVHTLHTPDFTLTAEMTGKLAIELLSPDRYDQNLELALGKDPVQLKSKLKQVYDPAVCALTAEPEMAFESGLVKIKAPLFAEHDAGFYTIKVEAESPTHLAGILKLQPLSGAVMAGGRKCRFDAEIELKAAVDWHPMPKEKVIEQTRVGDPHEQPIFAPSERKTGWQMILQKTDEILTMVVLVMIGIAVSPGVGSRMTGQTTSVTPFMHSVDPHNPRYLEFRNNNGA